MTTDQLKDRLEAKPFVPFTIRRSHGMETRITHPEAMGFRGGIATYIHPDERVEIIDLMLVVSLQVDESHDDSGPGGRKRRSKGE
jgi:hypothetical protein